MFIKLGPYQIFDERFRRFGQAVVIPTALTVDSDVIPLGLRM